MRRLTRRASGRITRPDAAADQRGAGPRPAAGRTIVVAVGVIGLALSAFTACGAPQKDDDDGVVSLVGATHASGSTPSPSSTMSEEDLAFKFAACMRENGVDMPDPEIDPNGGIRMRIGGSKSRRPDPKVVEAAQKKCKQYEPFGGKPPKLSAEQLERLQKMAECMREHGIDMPDPGPDGRIELHSEKKGPGTNAVGVDPDDPKFQAAQKACEKFMPDMDASRKKEGS